MRTSLEIAVGEMHLIAYCYNWDRDTLWNMKRSERKMWSKMVLAQKKAEAGSVPNDNNDSVLNYKES